MKEPFTIAILAAGQGTRFKSKRAKVLHAAGGRTLIEHVVRTARELPAGNLFVIVGYQAEAVMAAVKAIPGPMPGSGVQFVRQEGPLGTGHAVRCGRADLELAAPHLMVLSGDTPLLEASTLRRFVDFHMRSDAAASVMTADLEDPSGYGRIVRGVNDSITAIVEHKSASPQQLRIQEINTGIYCFRTRSLFAELERLAPDPITKEFYLTDVVGLLHSRGLTVAAHKASDTAEVTGVNTRVELAEVDHLLRERKARALMLSGVTLLQPASILLDPDVEVGADTVIEPGVSLLGKTRVGENCRIGAHSIITDSELADGVTVKPSCVITESKVFEGASIGPFSQLRPESEIGPDARIGNFVEVKKSRIGRGSKAQHLTYLGDATVGEDSNIGAGTITCNYDGERKSRTVIEDHVFVGSGTELVAPVRIGRNAYVAAGSTIHEDVPPDSLAIARSRQVSKPGWVARRKKKLAESKKAE
jgi:bifunctional UDP-N-acetylglucosamine pyrophosphorylase/glucosamine-1-phosphate N-acetyltransferase